MDTLHVLLPDEPKLLHMSGRCKQPVQNQFKLRARKINRKQTSLAFKDAFEYLTAYEAFLAW